MNAGYYWSRMLAIAAACILSGFLRNGPVWCADETHQKEVQYQRILTLVRNDDLRQAFKESEVWKNAYPDDPRAKDLGRKCAEIYRKLMTGTTEYYDGGGENYIWWSGTPTVGEILVVRGKAYFKKREYEVARRYFVRVVEQYPNDEYYPEALRYKEKCDELMGKSGGSGK